MVSPPLWIGWDKLAGTGTGTGWMFIVHFGSWLLPLREYVWATCLQQQNKILVKLSKKIKTHILMNSQCWKPKVMPCAPPLALNTGISGEKRWITKGRQVRTSQIPNYQSCLSLSQVELQPTGIGEESLVKIKSLCQRQVGEWRWFILLLLLPQVYCSEPTLASPYNWSTDYKCGFKISWKFHDDDPWMLFLSPPPTEEGKENTACRSLLFSDNCSTDWAGEVSSSSKSL